MNEFTKDELCILFKCVRLSERDYGECSDLDNVKFKIQSMIDNYCEHENAGQDYSCNRCWDCGECW